MIQSQQKRFAILYETQVKALKLQGKSTVDAYSRTVRRIAEYFERCADRADGRGLESQFFKPSKP